MYVRYSSLYLPYLGISEHSLLGIRAPPQDSVVPVLDGTNLPMGYSRKEDQDRLCRTRQDVQQTPEKGQGLYYNYLFWLTLSYSGPDLQLAYPGRGIHGQMERW